MNLTIKILQTEKTVLTKMMEITLNGIEMKKKIMIRYGNKLGTQTIRVASKFEP